MKWYDIISLVKWYHIPSRVSFLFTALSHWYPHIICNRRGYKNFVSVALSNPTSPSRMIVLLKSLWHIIENLKTKNERKERSFRQNRKKGIIFRANAINKKGAKTFRCVATFPVKVTWIYLTSLLKKSAEFIGSEQL